MTRYEHTAPALPTPACALARLASVTLARLRVLALGLLLGMAAAPLQRLRAHAWRRGLWYGGK